MSNFLSGFSSICIVSADLQISQKFINIKYVYIKYRNKFGTSSGLLGNIMK